MVDAVKNAPAKLGNLAKQPTTWLFVGGALGVYFLISNNKSAAPPAQVTQTGYPQQTGMIPLIPDVGGTDDNPTDDTVKDYSPFLNLLPGFLNNGGGFAFQNGDTSFVFTPPAPTPVVYTPAPTPTFADQINQLFGSLASTLNPANKQDVQVTIGEHGTGTLSVIGRPTTLADVLAGIPGIINPISGGTITIGDDELTLNPAPAPIIEHPIYMLPEPPWMNPITPRLPPVRTPEPVYTPPVIKPVIPAPVYTPAPVQPPTQIPTTPIPAPNLNLTFQQLLNLIDPWRADQQNWSTNLYVPRPAAFTLGKFSYNPAEDTVRKYNNMGSGTTNRGSAFGVFLYRLNMNILQMQQGKLASERSWMKTPNDAIQEAVQFVNKNAANGTTGLRFG